MEHALTSPGSEPRNLRFTIYDLPIRHSSAAFRLQKLWKLIMGLKNMRLQVCSSPLQPKGCAPTSRRKSNSVNRKSSGALNSPVNWFFILLITATCALAQQRFPPPDFENGHQLPVTTMPAPRAFLLQYLDVAVLASCLGAASWLVYRKRARKGVVALSIFSLLYFGFWRKGCVCSIGSLQNIALALTDTNYFVPLTIVAFFLLPLFFAVFAGRTFCAAVCPHGALQDLVLLKPIKVPFWLEQALSILPFVYLGLGVLFAATGSAFIICQYDPFVPIFRMNGRTLMVATGIALLLLGTFVGRPFCRFLCPYGALLKIGATLAKWRVRITPNTCTQCRLCETSCPFGALREPEAAVSEAPALPEDRRRLAFLLALLPLLIAAGGWLGWRFSVPASMVHPTVQLAERLVRAPEINVRIGPLSPDELSLERARRAPGDIVAAAKQIRRKFSFGSSIFGAWVGLVVGVKLISLSLRRRRIDYEPDRGECFACARCFEYCPNEIIRRGLAPAAIPAAPAWENSGLHSSKQASSQPSRQLIHVAQIFNLLYRRFLTCARYPQTGHQADYKSAIQQISNLRCKATGNLQPAPPCSSENCETSRLKDSSA